MKSRLRQSCVYLQDTCTEILGYRFYGSPWTPAALGWGFFRERGKPIRCVWQHMLKQHRLKPIDILITHGPAFGIGDSRFGPPIAPCVRGEEGESNASNLDNKSVPSIIGKKLSKGHVGDSELLKAILAMSPRPLYHIFGHVQSAYGAWTVGNSTFVNAATANQNVKLAHEPVIIYLPRRVA
uniref:Uncharacterized protein n=1 Tax=Lotharella oceanica TaxID=641309 RepID=A0A7S2XCF6_9EUKA|mmetsp:Transcript_30148/g.56328  ORF Transcript_30148/g.56328 Transcript_30148/m.56328 type:complete len:182 (+) Transcript_30148:469-1014(+)